MVMTLTILEVNMDGRYKCLHSSNKNYQGLVILKDRLVSCFPTCHQHKSKASTVCHAEILDESTIIIVSKNSMNQTPPCKRELLLLKILESMIPESITRGHYR